MRKLPICILRERVPDWETVAHWEVVGATAFIDVAEDWVDCAKELPWLEREYDIVELDVPDELE